MYTYWKELSEGLEAWVVKNMQNGREILSGWQKMYSGGA